jgi:hypothetical protein
MHRETHPDLKSRLPAALKLCMKASGDPKAAVNDRAEEDARQPLLRILDDVLHEIHADLVACGRGELLMSLR